MYVPLFWIQMSTKDPPQLPRSNLYQRTAFWSSEDHLLHKAKLLKTIAGLNINIIKIYFNQMPIHAANLLKGIFRDPLMRSILFSYTY